MARKILFKLGQVAATPGALAVLDKFPGGASYGTLSLITRHQSGDWGEMDAEDKKANDDALKPGDEQRLLSAYMVDGKKVWIITEWDRSVTTLLLPDEY